MGQAAKLRAERKATRPGPYTKVQRVTAPPIPGTDSVGGLGSDRILKRDVPGRCFLCREHTDRLERSHVLPKWAGRWSKQEGEAERATGRKPRGAFYSGKPGDSVTAVTQDMSWHYMLCRACEEWLSPGERILEQIATATTNSLEARGVLAIEAGSRVVGDRYRHLVQRALFGTLVKVHYAPSSVGRLNDAQARAIADRVLADDYEGITGPYGVKWYSFATDGRRVLGNPRSWPSSGVGPRGGNELTLGGITWFIPTSRTDPFAEVVRVHEWAVLVGDFRLRFTRDDSDEFVDSWARMSPTDLCPCGSGAEVVHCCDGSWVRLRRACTD